MRKSLWIVLALVVATSAPVVHADSFTDGTLNFTGGNPNASGSFVWDNTTSKWVSFTVDWDGAVADFTGIPNLAAVPLSGSWCAIADNMNPGCAGGGIFALDIYLAPLSGGSFIDHNASSEGTFTVTETAVGAPEPSSVALMLLGLVLVLVLRMRNSQGRQLAT